MHRLIILAAGLIIVGANSLAAEEPTNISIWPNLAPNETDLNTGVKVPSPPKRIPPITLLEQVRRPTMQVVLPTAKSNGTAVLILPGGGYARVVPDLEGTEAADQLAKLGVTSFVLSYRTNEVTPEDEPAWRRPLQDGQRAMRWIRTNASQWNLDTNRIGLLAFSAGGQVAAILITTQQPAYDEIDRVDSESFRPDFAMLIYPWRCYDEEADSLLSAINVTPRTPPTFIVHTDDDRSSSLGSALLYADLKRNNVPSELHIYETGGHGYGTRDRPNSNIGTWTNRATDWLARKLP